MSGEQQIWERYLLNVSDVDNWPTGYEDVRKEIIAQIQMRDTVSGSSRHRIIGPDNDVLTTVTKNIAAEVARSEDRESVAYIEVDLLSLDAGESFRTEDERDQYIRQQLKDKKQQLGDAMLASQVGSTVLVLKNVNAVPSKWQASFFSVLDDHFCNVPDGARGIEGDPENLVTISTMRSDYDGYDFDLKFASLMGGAKHLEQ